MNKFKLGQPVWMAGVDRYNTVERSKDSLSSIPRCDPVVDSGLCLVHDDVVICLIMGSWVKLFPISAAFEDRESAWAEARKLADKERAAGC